MHGTLHKAIAFEAAQCLSEHFLRNPTDLALKRSVTHRAARKDLDGQRGPFVSNTVEYQPRGTAWIEHRRSRGTFWHDSCVEQLRYRSKSEGYTPREVYGS